MTSSIHHDASDLARQLQAAERTVAVLKKRVLALQDGGGQSIIDKQLELSRRRFEAQERRRELMEVRAQELEAHKARLEGEVADRTRAIRTIQDNVRFGFFLVARNGVVDDGATRSCGALFGKNVVGLHFDEVIGGSDVERAHATLALEQVFEDIIPEDVALSIVPSETRVGDRILSLSGSLVRDPDGTPRHVLFSVADVTDLHASRKQAELNRALVQIMAQRGAFRSFVADLRHLLDDAEHAIAQGDGARVRRHVHTVKGNAASFGLHDVVAVVHDIEEHAVIDAADLGRVRDAVRRFFDENGAILAMDFDNHDDAVVLTGALKEELFALGRAPDAPAGLRALLEELRLRPIGDLLAPVPSMCERLAERLGKAVVVHLDGVETRVDTERYGPVITGLTHLVRNAIDHGIEPVPERGAKGPHGHIDIRLRAEPDAWVLTVADDGRGLDRAAVADRARALGLYDSDDLPSDEELFGLISAEGLSTAAEVSDVSGRGIGLAAVREAAVASGAAIRLTTVPAQGTAFTISMPRANSASEAE